MNDRIAKGLRRSVASLACCLGCSTLVVGLGGDHPPTNDDAGLVCQYDVDCAPWHGLCGPDGGCQPLPPDGGYSANQTSNTCDPDGGSQPCAGFALATEPSSYCTSASGANLCYCHPDPFFDQGGVCYRAIPQCGACSQAIDCGGTQTDLNNGGSSCMPVADAGNYCLWVDFGGCAPAYSPQPEPDAGLFCYPVCNTCPCVACLNDADCSDPAKGVCVKGGCRPPCLVQSDCAPGQVCNVLGKYLDPALGDLYGHGKCGAPCTRLADCAQYQGDAGPTLTCVTDDHYLLDGGSIPDDGGTSRCRLDACMGTDDCVIVLSDAGGNSWCDLWGGNRCVDSYCQLATTSMGPPSNQAQCQIGFCCSGDAGSPPQNPTGPSHGVCIEGSSCTSNASLSAGGN